METRKVLIVVLCVALFGSIGALVYFLGQKDEEDKTAGAGAVDDDLLRKVLDNSNSVDNLQSRVGAVEVVARDARDDAAENQIQLFSLQSDTTSAQSDATQALVVATDADTKADTAQTDASNALNTASQASTAAATADDKAVTAQTNATNAQTTANAANSNADLAINDSSQALSLAQDANVKINDLSSISAYNSANVIDMTAGNGVPFTGAITTGPDPPSLSDIINIFLPSGQGRVRKYIVQWQMECAVYPAGNAQFSFERQGVPIQGTQRFLFDTFSGTPGLATEFGSVQSGSFQVEGDDQFPIRIQWLCTQKNATTVRIRRPLLTLTEIL